MLAPPKPTRIPSINSSTTNLSFHTAQSDSAYFAAQPSTLAASSSTDLLSCLPLSTFLPKALNPIPRPSATASGTRPSIKQSTPPPMAFPADHFTHSSHCADCVRSGSRPSLPRQDTRENRRELHLETKLPANRLSKGQPSEDALSPASDTIATPPTASSHQVWLCSPPVSPSSPAATPPLPRSTSSNCIKTARSQRPIVTRAMTTGRISNSALDEGGAVISMSAHSDKILRKGVCPSTWRAETTPASIATRRRESEPASTITEQIGRRQENARVDAVFQNRLGSQSDLNLETERGATHKPDGMKRVDSASWKKRATKVLRGIRA